MSSSVIAATLVSTVLNEESSIVHFLDSISAQSRIPAQIVIVDGGSTDTTAVRIENWRTPAGCELKLLIERGAGISRGRNLAIENSNHETILVTDAGTELDPRWIERMSDSFSARGGVDVVSGFFHPTGTTWMQRLIAFTITPRLAEIAPADFLPSSRSIAFTKSAWRNAGGYPEWLDYCEDLVFDFALRDSGATFVFRPDADVSWAARPTLSGFMKQYYRYARGDGKAGLWARRHAIRYGTYGVVAAALLIGARKPLALAVLPVGAAVYLRKFWVRILARRVAFGDGAFCALLGVPVVVIAGDIAKMCGYPAGLTWRRSHRDAPSVSGQHSNE